MPLYQWFWDAAAQQEEDPKPPDVFPEEQDFEDAVELEHLVDTAEDGKKLLKPSAFHTALLEISGGYQCLC